MKLRQIIALGILLAIVVRGVAFAQDVDIPDPHLRAAIRDALLLSSNDPIPIESMRRITNLNIAKRNIQSLEGLQFAIRLESLDIADNHVTDFSPLSNLKKLFHVIATKNGITDLTTLGNLTQLRKLSLSDNPVTDIRPLANLVNLERLSLSWCRELMDINALANLSKLRHLSLSHNKIRDITPLASLHNLEILHISHNYIVDHSPVDDLQLREFIYDQECDMPDLASIPRIENRQFPSIFGAFSGTTLNQHHLSRTEQFAQHDMVFKAPFFELELFGNGDYWEIRGDINDSIARRGTLLSLNPNLLFLVELRFFNAGCKNYPESWPYWKRDEHGNIVRGGRWCGIDFTNPGFQDLLVSQAIAVSKCGLYDGIFLDWWNELGSPDELQARETIIRRIRANTRSDLLILVNTNDRLIPHTAPFINGAFIESFFPHSHTGEELEKRVTRGETVLSWAESNLKPPVINALAAGTYEAEPPDSLYNLRWMRVVTTLSLTHSDGYVYFHVGTHEPPHYWYDFWDADLGQPVGEKEQLYQEIEGLYIREFTNGWAVYNHSGKQQVVNLPEKIQGVSSGWVGTTHVLPNLDGEMYLRVKPVNTADVNGDGVVNILDLVAVAQAFGKDGLRGDVNGDGVVNVFDLIFVAGAIGGGGAAPSESSLELSIVSAADVERWLALAQGLGVGDANFLRGIRFLEGLLAALTPEETMLLPNYPNPFNPETWIPYHLARAAEVAITIYDTKGTPVRRLAIGNQSAGYYAERGKAAYWDGRNEDGEAVSSGIYVYHFQAGDYAASRRMVIVK